MSKKIMNSETWIPKEFFMLYCGDNKLSKFYDRAVEKNNINLRSFNLFALLVPPLWFSSRKQWDVMLYFLIILVLDSAFETFFNINLPSILISFLIIIAPSVFSYSLILRKATTKYNKLKSNGLNEEEIKTSLKDNIKTSYKMAILGPLAWIAIFSIALLIMSIFTN